MDASDQVKVKNRLLRSLGPEDFARLAPDLVEVAMLKGDVLIEADRPFCHAWFPESAIGSILAISPEGHTVESGLFGRDGFAPDGLALSAELSPHKTIVQVEGRGIRIGVGALREAFDASVSLRRLLLRYASTLSVQTSFTALSNAVHPIDERLARWLLMCHDRIDGDDLVLTHEFLSIMLAVRRPSVTTALHVLEGNRFIKAERAHIVIRDRAGLEEFAKDAYGRPEREYRRLIGPL